MTTALFRAHPPPSANNSLAPTVAGGQEPSNKSGCAWCDFPGREAARRVGRHRDPLSVPGEVVVDVNACGVCHTEQTYREGTRRPYPISVSSTQRFVRIRQARSAACAQRSMPATTHRIASTCCWVRPHGGSPTASCLTPVGNCQFSADVRHTKWNTAIKQAGVPPLTIHDLRHTYASLARAAGAELRFVQRTLGHSSPVVTANIYSDLYDSELNSVATNLDRIHENSAFPTGQEPDTKKNP